MVHCVPMWQSGGLTAGRVVRASKFLGEGEACGVVTRGVRRGGSGIPAVRHGWPLQRGACVLRRPSSMQPTASHPYTTVLALNEMATRGSGGGGGGAVQRSRADGVWRGWHEGGAGLPAGTAPASLGWTPSGHCRHLFSAAGQRAAGSDGAMAVKPPDDDDDDDNEGDPSKPKKKKGKESKVELTLATVRAKKEDELANLNYSTLVEEKQVEVPKVTPPTRCLSAIFVSIWLTE